MQDCAPEKGGPRDLRKSQAQTKARLGEEIPMTKNQIPNESQSQNPKKNLVIGVWNLFGSIGICDLGFNFYHWEDMYGSYRRR
jgi:hypothetical protein